MARPFSFILTLSLLFFFFTSSSIADETGNFLRCFQAIAGSNATHILHLPNTTLYNSIFEANARNLRPVASPTSSKPSLLAAPEEEGHVSAIAKCAYAADLEIRTRSGGHDYEGMSYVSKENAVEHPFLLIDLALLANVDVNAHHRTAWVQAGATIGQLYYHVFNKTGGTGGFPAGTCPTLGVGGHLSVGGIGTMMRKYGVAADNVVDVRMVGKDGVVMNRKLMGKEVFWAVRGGGAQSWGIVVAFKIRIVDVPPVVATFSVNKNISISNSDGASFMTRWQDFAPKADRNLIIQVTLVATPGSSGATIQLQLLSLYLGNCAHLVPTVSRAFPNLSFNCTEMTWLQSVLFFFGLPLSGNGVDALLTRTPAPPNTSFKIKSDFVTDPITQPQWQDILTNMQSYNTSFWMQLLPLGGRMSEISTSAIPFPHRKGNLFNIQYLAAWTGSDEAETSSRLEFTQKLYSMMAPYVSSNPRAAYYGFKDYDLGKMFPSYEEARSSWGANYFKGNFERLSRVKRMVDAGNYFKNEQSIPVFQS